MLPPDSDTARGIHLWNRKASQKGPDSVGRKGSADTSRYKRRIDTPYRAAHISIWYAWRSNRVATSSPPAFHRTKTSPNRRVSHVDQCSVQDVLYCYMGMCVETRRNSTALGSDLGASFPIEGSTVSHDTSSNREIGVLALGHSNAGKRVAAWDQQLGGVWRNDVFWGCWPLCMWWWPFWKKWRESWIVLIPTCLGQPAMKKPLVHTVLC